MTKIICFIFLLANLSWATEKLSLDKIVINQTISPRLFNLIINQFQNIELVKDIESSREQIIEDLILLNENTRYYTKYNFTLQINGEFYKYFLSKLSNHETNYRQITPSLYINLKAKLKENKLVYSPMATFIIQGILDDLSPYIQDDFILHYQNKSRKESKNAFRIRKLKLLEKYIVPWIGVILNKSASKFNTFLVQESVEFIHLFAENTKLLKVSGANPVQKEYILSGLEQIKTHKSQDPAKDPKVSDEADEKRRNPKKDVEVLKDVPDDAAPEVLDKFIKNIAQ